MQLNLPKIEPFLRKVVRYLLQYSLSLLHSRCSTKCYMAFYTNLDSVKINQIQVQEEVQNALIRHVHVTQRYKAELK